MVMIKVYVNLNQKMNNRFIQSLSQNLWPIIENGAGSDVTFAGVNVDTCSIVFNQ